MIRRSTALPHAGAAGRDRWMVSYTDVMTILLILFIAVAARAVQQATQSPTSAAAGTLTRTKADLEARGFRPSMEVRGLVISLPQTVLYPSGEDRVSIGAFPLIGRIAGAIRGIPNKVTLVGHADTVPIHNGRFSNNWELSAARSLRLLELLTSRYGIAESRLAVSSLGSWSPRSTNDTEEGRADNRCVEIVIENDSPSR